MVTITYKQHSGPDLSCISYLCSLLPSLTGIQFAHASTSQSSLNTMKTPSLRRRLLLLLLLVVVAASWLQACDAASGFCASKCAVRCGPRARGSACLRTCGLCCEECNCVPTGTGGSRDECPCYRDMLTAGPRKRPKCP